MSIGMTRDTQRYNVEPVLFCIASMVVIMACWLLAYSARHFISGWDVPTLYFLPNNPMSMNTIPMSLLVQFYCLAAIGLSMLSRAIPCAGSFSLLGSVVFYLSLLLLLGIFRARTLCSYSGLPGLSIAIHFVCHRKAFFALISKAVLLSFVFMETIKRLGDVTLRAALHNMPPWRYYIMHVEEIQ